MFKEVTTLLTVSTRSHVYLQTYETQLYQVSIFASILPISLQKKKVLTKIFYGTIGEPFVLTSNLKSLGNRKMRSP